MTLCLAANDELNYWRPVNSCWTGFRRGARPRNRSFSDRGRNGERADGGISRRRGRLDTLSVIAANPGQQRLRESDELGPGRGAEPVRSKRRNMRYQRRIVFEPLESRLCLSVSATVSHGDLVVTGDADGAVEITAVGAGGSQVTDNGSVIADGTDLQGVTDDIHIDIDESAARGQHRHPQSGRSDG